MFTPGDGGSFGSFVAGQNHAGRSGKVSRTGPIETPSRHAARLFSAVVSGITFDVFARDIPARPSRSKSDLSIPKATAAGAYFLPFRQRHARSMPISTSGHKAGGAFKPWVMKTTFIHAGGDLALQFAGLGKPAFVSYARISDAQRQGARFRHRQGLEKGRAADAARFPLAAVSSRQGGRGSVLRCGSQPGRRLVDFPLRHGRQRRRPGLQAAGRRWTRSSPTRESSSR